jgi:putative phosphoesterase
MKLLVMGDTHGETGLAAALIESFADADHVIHLGDCSSDARMMAFMLKRRIISVSGNCDFDSPGAGHRILKAECGDILIVHGHRENVKQGLGGLCRRAAQLGCVAAFYGHTHVARVDRVGALTLVSPGSLSWPRGGALPSYAVADTSPGGLSASVVFVTDSMAAALGVET